MTTEHRNSHPYHMYDAILAQPEAFVGAIERNGDAVDEFASLIASCERIFLAGIGTSHHATLVGEHLMRTYGGGPDVRAVHSFDLALYGPELRQEDCLVAVSHRGAKRYTALALGQAREKGCPTALITGEGGSGEGRADVVFQTVAQEKSSAHTVSYTSAVAMLALLAGRLGYHRTGSATLPEEFLREELPEALRVALGKEDEVAAVAREHVGRRRIWLVGGGPSAVTATETALKIKETSYLQAEGMPTETMLHGPFQCVEADDLFVLSARRGDEDEEVVRLDALEGTVQHRLRRHALGLEVGGLFDLEGRLCGRHRAGPTANEPDPTPPDVLAGDRSDFVLLAQGHPQRLRKLLPQELLGQRGRACPVVAEPPREKREHRHRARVADRMCRGLLLRHRLEHDVRTTLAGAPFARYERRRAALLPGLSQREGRVAFGAAVAHGDEAVLLAQLRPVEREVEGVDSTDVGPAAVGPHQVLADEGCVVRGSDTRQEDPLAGGYQGRELVDRVTISLDGPDERFGLGQDRVVHVVGVRIAMFGRHAFSSFVSTSASQLLVLIALDNRMIVRQALLRLASPPSGP